MTTLKDSPGRELTADQGRLCEKGVEEKEEQQELEKEERRSGPGAQTQEWQRRK